MKREDQKRVLELLHELTEWQRKSGLPVMGSSDIRSTGESNAAIDNLKRQLDQLGAHYHWSEGAGEFQLDPDEPYSR